MTSTMPNQLSRTIRDRLTVLRRDRTERDRYDLPLTATADAAQLYRDAQHQLLAVQTGADGPLRLAVARDPDFALGNATLALLEHDAGRDGSVHLRAAVRSAYRASARERSFVAAVASRLCHAPDREARLLHHLAEHPRDAVALTVAVPTIASSGAIEVPEQAWSLVESRRRDFGDDWWFSGLLAWVRQEQGRFAEAGELATWSLSVQPAAGHAAHSLAHVFYETSHHEEGLRWVDDWVGRNRGTTLHAAHYSWHAALHELAMGDHDAVRQRWARELSPLHVQGVRALVDSGSLLWRAHLAGAWPGLLPVDDVLDVVDEGLLTEPPTPFVALHAAVALAARGDAAALRMLGRSASLDDRPVFRDVVAPFCAALAALVAGRPDRAAELLLGLMPHVERFGGSKAQREIVEQTLLHALVRAGRSEPAQRLLQVRLDRPVR